MANMVLEGLALQPSLSLAKPWITSLKLATRSIPLFGYFLFLTFQITEVEHSEIPLGYPNSVSKPSKPTHPNTGSPPHFCLLTAFWLWAMSVSTLSPGNSLFLQGRYPFPLPLSPFLLTPLSPIICIYPWADKSPLC